MKTRDHWTWSLGLVLAALPLSSYYAQEAPNQPAINPPSVAQGVAADPAAQQPADQTGAAAQGAEPDLADAAFQPISTEKPLPAQVKPTAPVAEVIRLAESGVEEGVILAYVTNSPSMFNLGPDDIIYLNDIGLPGAVVTAMIQRDQTLKGLPGNNSGALAARSPPNAPPDQFAPVPEGPAPDMAPPPTPQPPEEMPSDAALPPDYGPVDSALPPPDDGTYSTFYDALAPYGTWVDVAGYGPCWQPTVVVGNPYWQPYCNGGRWVYSDCGWYWLSSYSWGWAPFHYGRWFRHNSLGWCWAPDTAWGPSWVCWRYGSAYCGWAPLPPGAWYRAGVGLTFRGQPVGNTFGFGLGARSFAVVPFNHFWDHHVSRYALPQQQAGQVLKGTVASASILGSNNRVINNGLPPSRVAAATGTSIHRVAVHDSYAPNVHGVRAERLEASGTSLSVFRPSFAPHSGPQPAAANGRTVTTEITPRGALIVTGRKDPAPASGYWAGHADQPGAANSRTVVTEITPRGALIMTGRRDPALGRTSAYSNPQDVPQAAARPYSSYSSPKGAMQGAATPHNSFPRAEVYQKPQTQPGLVSEVQRPSYPAWSSPHPAPAQWHYSAPSYQAPEVPRPAPAPAYTPPQHTYSAPAPSYTPPSHVTESHATYSAPSAPALLRPLCIRIPRPKDTGVSRDISCLRARSAGMLPAYAVRMIQAVTCRRSGLQEFDGAGKHPCQAQIVFCFCRRAGVGTMARMGITPLQFKQMQERLGNPRRAATPVFERTCH